MNSMTGFGRGEYKDGEVSVTVEIRTVNHRYRDFFIKMPYQFNSFEDKLRQALSARIKRGRIEFFLNVKFLVNKPVTLYLDTALAEQYYNILSEIAERYPGVSGEITPATIARFSDVIKSEEDTGKYAVLLDGVMAAVDAALEMLCAARAREGTAMKKDILEKNATIRTLLHKIETQTDGLVEHYAVKVREALKKYDLNEIDENRLAGEVAYLAERASVDEEITRLKNHIATLVDIVEEDEQTGRKLDFIIQEMNREANTIGSKSNSADVSLTVVEIKSEIEKIREQVQNIE